MFRKFISKIYFQVTKARVYCHAWLCGYALGLSAKAAKENKPEKNTFGM